MGKERGAQLKFSLVVFQIAVIGLCVGSKARVPLVSFFNRRVHSCWLVHLRHMLYFRFDYHIRCHPPNEHIGGLTAVQACILESTSRGTQFYLSPTCLERNLEQEG